MGVTGDNNENELNVFSLNVYFKGEQISLRAKEKCLLEVLIKSSPVCVPRDKIAVEVWGGGFVSDFTINQTINSLRRKINDSGRLLIKTKPREGYVIDKDVAELFSFDKNNALDITSEDAIATQQDYSSVLSSYSLENHVKNNNKIKSKRWRRTVQRVYIMTSLLLACGLTGVGIGSISGIIKDKNMELYLDGVKFIFHSNHIEFRTNDKKIKCSLLKRILDDGEVIITSTTHCQEQV